MATKTHTKEATQLPREGPEMHGAEDGDGSASGWKNPAKQDPHCGRYLNKRQAVEDIRDSLLANPNSESLTKHSNHEHERLSHDVHY